jgi:hypothetical protein
MMSNRAAEKLAAGMYEGSCERKYEPFRARSKLPW